MQTSPEPVTLAQRPATTCRHHWVIEIANGPTSQGRCKRCGARRDFFNNVEDALKPKHTPAEAN